MRNRKPSEHPSGRPSKRTPEVAERILGAVAKGVPVTHACRLGGIAPSTFHEWRNSDPAFRERIEEAVAVAIEKRLAIIEEMAATDWRCCAWYLEHVHPQAFARNRLEVTGADGSPLVGAIAVCLPAKKDSNGSSVVTVAPAREIEDAD